MPINQIRSCKNQMLTPKQIEVRIAWESNSNLITKKVCEWMKKHNNLCPKQVSKDKEERKLGAWLNCKKTAYNRNGIGPHGVVFYDSDMEVAKKCGYYNLFTINNCERKSNNMTHKICKWMIKHNHRYFDRSVKSELKMLKWLSQISGIKKGSKSAGTYYLSDQKIAESYGIPDLFDKTNCERKSNSKTHQLCQWIKDNNNRYPLLKSEDKIEHNFRRWLDRKRSGGSMSNGSHLYQSDIKIAGTYGFHSLFDRITFEIKSNLKTHRICNWKKNHDGKSPSTYSNDEEEIYLGSVLVHRRMAKSGNLANSVFYDSDQEIAESYGYGDLFEKIYEWRSKNSDVI